MDRDNQQETIKDVELAWLAGFLDSDGSVQMTMPAAEYSKLKRIINVWVDFSNSDAMMIEKATSIISRMGISFHLAQKKVRPIYKEDGSKFLPRKEICLAIRIGKLSSAKTILEKLVPYMAGSKAAQARIIIRYCEKRIPKGRRSYEVEDLMIVREFFENQFHKVALRNLLHLDGLLNDYTTGTVKSDDIV